MATKKINIRSKPTGQAVPDIDRLIETRTVEPKVSIGESKRKIKRLTLYILNHYIGQSNLNQ